MHVAKSERSDDVYEGVLVLLYYSPRDEFSKELERIFKVMARIYGSEASFIKIKKSRLKRSKLIVSARGRVIAEFSSLSSLNEIKNAIEIACGIALSRTTSTG